ncbi:A G-specific DNA glycosylase [Staphylococcus gallinarum]|uniref:A G-specific DNA glycosylase n=1 Tax=Staphylococcus gallinarum TaxID=1293 RepID=A0A380FKT2_STAGA|nr:A G-specific DNA glycosylase [Staphylococcus gallinarum]
MFKENEFKTNLVTWFDENQREMPWRETSNPYYIWLSEVMLQQTQVKTVIDYYLRFTKRFPTIEDLSNAHEDDVLKYWEGLGYYSRARIFIQQLKRSR